MFLLSIYPISGYYETSIGFTVGQLLLFFFIVICILIYGANRVFCFPKFYYFFWTYTAIALLITQNSFKITNLVPGGINFFTWSLCLGMGIVFFKYDLFKKYMKCVFGICTIVFVAQEIMHMRTGVRFSAILPISDYFYGGSTSYFELTSRHSIGSRSPSLFIEPAYFAQYTLILLSLMLFDSYRNYLRSDYIIIISAILVLVFLKSGCGIIGLIYIFIYKIISLYKDKGGIKFLLLLFLILPFVIYFVQLYFSSDIGVSMVERQDEFYNEDSGSSAYTRVVRGFQIYGFMPFVNQVFGISTDDMFAISAANGMPLERNVLATNGFQRVLIQNGIIGLFILFCFYIRLLKYNKTRLASALLGLLFVFSLMESVYLSPDMLIMTIIIATEYKNCKEFNTLRKLPLPR